MVSPQLYLVLVPPPRPSRLPTGSSALKEVSTVWWPRGLLFESVLILSPGIPSPILVFFEACEFLRWVLYRTRGADARKANCSFWSRKFEDAHSRPFFHTNVRHEGGRARPCGWARWNRRRVVSRCASDFPLSTRAPRAPRACSTGPRASLEAYG